MASIETMRGPIDSGALGRVLVHEHIFTMNVEFVQNYRPDFVEDERVDEAVEQMNALKAAGVDTIIDLTVLGLGRYIPRIARVAERTNLNIIVSTGAYTLNEVPTSVALWGPGLMFDAPEPLVDMFVADITDGINGTSVKAGELKCAIDMAGMTPGVERVMRAVARTHAITGTPITVHTAPQNQSGLTAQAVFAEEGVNLEDVIIGHCGDTPDLDYLMRLADRGSILGMDRFGINFVMNTQDRVRVIAELVKRGYLDRITLSHDCMCWADVFPSPEARAQVVKGHDFMHICDHVIPALHEAGLSQAQVDTMFIDNPRRHFEAAAARFAARG